LEVEFGSLQIIAGEAVTAVGKLGAAVTDRSMGALVVAQLVGAEVILTVYLPAIAVVADATEYVGEVAPVIGAPFLCH
jgi:hypothetical protein